MNGINALIKEVPEICLTLQSCEGTMRTGSGLSTDHGK